MNAHCRIRRVRFKAGGEMRVLDRAPAENGLHDDLRRRVGILVESFPDMAGFAVVVWDDKGWFSRGTGWNNRLSPIGQTLLPSFVAEVLRRDTVEDVVRDRFEVR
ncbi:MAG TPA: hypothetical protein VFJ13_05750 [Paracoccaceae bacterium]|nr:hypothetical protein [Paracoccaceae bacterium]